MKKRFLIVVDMQNDFIDGSLGSAEAQAIVSPAADLIRKKRAEGYEIIATLDTHTDEYLSTREGKYLPVEHCIKGSEGWQLNPEIKDALGEALTLEKPTFGSVKLPGIVAERACGDPAPVIELLGLCTDICVVSNAMLLKAAFPEADLRVHAACCAGVTPQKHEAALETMRSCQIDII